MEDVTNLIDRFTPYIEDLRSRLYFTAVFFMVFFAIGFLSTSSILKYVLSFFSIKDVIVATTSPLQFTDLSMNVGLFIALIITFPVFIYNTLAFLRPALTQKERRLFITLIPLTLGLFFLGFLYGFFIMYFALIILAGINVSIGIKNIWDIGMFLSQIVLTSTLLGILFQFPVVMTFIIRLGLIDVSFLKMKRRIAIVAIFIFASLLPPSDGLSLIAMSLPLILLYECTIIANSLFQKVHLIPSTQSI